MQPLVYLASRSPRRRTLLGQIGVPFRTAAVDLEEVRNPGEPPTEFACRMARTKARLAWDGLAPGERLPVLGADTVVVIDGEVLGKPADPDEARAMLARLSGRQHQVLSAVALVAGASAERLSRSRVWLRALDASERAAYCATGEPLDKAGAYAIQGLGGIFVERLEGSYSGVMGLPLYETAELLAGAGIELLRAP